MGLFSALFGRPPRRRSKRSAAASERRLQASLREAERKLATQRKRAEQLERERERIEHQRQVANLRAEARRVAQAERVRPNEHRVNRARVAEVKTARAARKEDDTAAKLAKVHGGSRDEWAAVLARSNPARNPARLATALGTLHARAVAESQHFHGEGSETRVLTAAERAALPGEVVVLGELENMTYRPPGRSHRGGTDWEHKSGDYGLPGLLGKRRPLLVADPVTGRPAIVLDRSPMRFRDRLGLVG